MAGTETALPDNAKHHAHGQGSGSHQHEHDHDLVADGKHWVLTGKNLAGHHAWKENNTYACQGVD